MTKAERLAKRAASMPQVAKGTTAQFLMWREASPELPKQGALIAKPEPVLAERWANFHKEVLARPVEARCVSIK